MHCNWPMMRPNRLVVMPDTSLRWLSERLARSQGRSAVLSESPLSTQNGFRTQRARSLTSTNDLPPSRHLC